MYNRGVTRRSERDTGATWSCRTRRPSDLDGPALLARYAPATQLRREPLVTVTDDTIDHAADGSDLHIVGATQDSDLEIALDYAIGAAAVSSYGYVFNHDSYLEHTLAATGRTVPDLPDTTEFRKSR